MRKPLRLIWDDLRNYVTGNTVLRAADWRHDPWAYPTDWSGTLHRAGEFFGPFDSAGIPLQPASGGWHYNPTRIAGFALALWDARDRLIEWRAPFLSCADWFAAVPEARYTYSFDAAGMMAPWISCIAQGQAMSVLARAFVLTEDGRYLEQADCAVTPLRVPVTSGGLLDRLPDGSPFFEEYPGCYPHVLNGCLHTLVGLWDLARARSEQPDPLFAQVLEAVARNVEAWDADGWSTYDLEPRGRARNLATLNYHLLHCILLRYLADGAADDVRLKLMAERWESSAARIGARLRALQRKGWYRIAEGW